MYNQDPGRHRFRLVWALKNLGDNQPFQQEISRMSKAALEGADEGARREAIRTLSWFARDQARDVFQQALQDPSERVRREAQRALERGRERGRRG
jgi:HEAT repeat protein